MWLYILLNVVTVIPSLKVLLSRLDSLTFLLQINEVIVVFGVTTHKGSRWYFGRISNYKVVYVVVIDDVGDVSSGLMHVSAHSALFFSIGD